MQLSLKQLFIITLLVAVGLRVFQLTAPCLERGWMFPFLSRFISKPAIPGKVIPGDSDTQP